MSWQEQNRFAVITTRNSSEPLLVPYTRSQLFKLSVLCNQTSATICETTGPRQSVRCISHEGLDCVKLHVSSICQLLWKLNENLNHTVAYGGGGVGGFNHLPPKFRRSSKIVPNSNRLWKLLKIAEFRTPTPQDARKKGSKILKLPQVRNCFTLAMTNKLGVIINSLKITKIKKILLHEMKFLVPNYSLLQNPWLGD